MGRKMPGGAEVLDRLRDHVKVIRDLLAFDRRTIVLQPEDVEERRDFALERVREILDVLDRELPPLLERNERNKEAASIPERVGRLERELAELRQLIDQRSVRIVPNDRAAGGGA